MKTHGDAAPSGLLSGFGDIEGLRRLAVRLVRDDAEADDVVQESLLLALRRATGRALDLGAWLRGVVRNKARESRRAAARRQARASDVRPEKRPMDPIDIAARLEVHDQLVAAVKGLAEPYRSAVWLHYVEGKEASEMARETGVPVETVRTRIKRGIAMLRSDLDGRHGGKRADWVPSLAVFAGVEPSISLLAATTTAGTLAFVKPVAAAALVLVVLGSAFVGVPLLFKKSDASSTTPVQQERGKDGALAANRRSGPIAPDDAGTGASASERGADLAKIAGTRYADEPASAPKPDAPSNDGVFSFHYEQGFSFSSRGVSDDLLGADIVFKSCAGGVSSVTLDAPNGAIVNLERVKKRFPDLKHADALTRSVVRADPKVIGSSPTAEGDDREPASDAFLLRTREGRWVSLAIVERGESGDWQKIPITIHFVLNESEPVFHTGQGDVSVDGIEIDSKALATLDGALEDEARRAHEARIEPFKRRLAELDRKAAAMEPAVQARDGADVRVAAVLDRGFAAPMGFVDAFVAATYSFEKATRDDVDATRNDWDFEFSTRLDVRTVVDDRSRVWELGELPFASARSGAVAPAAGGEFAVVAQGRLYAIHTVDSDTDQWALMRIEELFPSEAIIFSWAVLKDASALQGAIDSMDPVMQSPVARLQIRGGAGGGNAVKVLLDGGSERVDELSSSPLDLQKPLSIDERHKAYVSGGKVPVGMVFRIERIEYAARVEGDSNGDGNFSLWVGGIPVANVRERPYVEEGKKQFRSISLDRGDQPVAVSAMPVRGDLSVEIEIARGDEGQVYAEIANSTWADVTLSGRFVPAAQSPQARRPRTDRSRLSLLEALAEASDAEVSTIAHSIDSDFAAALRSVVESIPAGPWRDKLRSALDQAGR